MLKHSFLYDIDAIYLVLIIFVLMLATVIAGYKLGIKKANADHDTSTLLSSLLALLGLLLAFTFGMSGSRYDDRRKDFVEEVNCIGTVVLRTELYPDSIKNSFKKDLKHYIDSRITYFEAKRDQALINESYLNYTSAGDRLWKNASYYSKHKDYYLQSMMMLPALNAMFDISTTVNETYNATVPDSIVFLLLVFSIVSSFFIGYNSGIKKTFDRLLTLGFCILTCVVIYIILDLDRPRRGIINTQDQMHLLKELKKSVN